MFPISSTLIGFDRSRTALVCRHFESVCVSSFAPSQNVWLKRNASVRFQHTFELTKLLPIRSRPTVAAVESKSSSGLAHLAVRSTKFDVSTLFCYFSVMKALKGTRFLTLKYFASHGKFVLDLSLVWVYTRGLNWIVTFPRINCYSKLIRQSMDC